MEKNFTSTYFVNTKLHIGYNPINILNKLRFFIFRLTNLNINHNHISFFFIASLIYNLFISIIPIIVIYPIVINYVINPSGNDINIYQGFNVVMSKYMYIEYIGCILLLLDFLIRLICCDYRYSLNRNRFFSIFNYIFRLSNFYQLTSTIILIVLFHIYGKFDYITHNWTIDINVLGSHFNTNISNDTANQTINNAIIQYNAWNPGQLIFVLLFIVNIIGIVPKVIFAFKPISYSINHKNLASILKENWKTPVIATLFLVLIIFIFSFTILKVEQSYYADWLSNNPDQSIENAPNYSYSPKNFGNAIWYCLITITTVGYGQIIPQSPVGRILAILLLIIGVSYYSFYTVFFVSIYSKFVNSKSNNNSTKSDNNNDELINKIKNDFINELVKYHVIDKQVYDEVNKNNISGSHNKNKKTITNNKNIEINKYLLINNWIKNKKKNKNQYLPDLKTEYEYKLNYYPIINKNYQIVLIGLDSNYINTLINAKKITSLNLPILFNINNIKKIVIYDINEKEPKLELLIDSINIKKTKSIDKYLFTYNIKNHSNYKNHYSLLINDFKEFDYLYLN